jgi:hypothetical protein
VQIGTTKLFSATVTGTNSPAQTVTWSVTGSANSGTSISASGGLLTIAANETATTLTVTATSTVDNTKKGTAIVTVSTVPVVAAVLSVIVSPDTASVAKGGTQLFTAAVAAQGNAAETVTWSVTSTTNSGTGIGSANGLLTVAADETATTLKVIATATFDNTKADTAIVTVTGSSNNDDDNDNDDDGDDDDDPATDDDPSTTVETLRATSLQPYPNPTSGIVHIDNPDGEDAEVYTVDGTLLLRSKAATIIDLSKYAGGTYIIQVGGKTAKVVKR